MSTHPAPSVTLRPLVRADLTVLTRLECALFGASAWSQAMLAEEVVGPDRWYIAAEVPAGAPAGVPAGVEALADPLAGYAGLWFDGDDAHVMTIAVARAHQGVGIGSALLEALVERAREVGAHSLLLEVRVDNVSALALYERFQFESIGRRRGYYQPENVDAWIMRRPLGPA